MSNDEEEDSGPIKRQVAVDETEIDALLDNGEKKNKNFDLNNPNRPLTDHEKWDL